jgi:membrane protein implicated in regulation of membrane protease activity
MPYIEQLCCSPEKEKPMTVIHIAIATSRRPGRLVLVILAALALVVGALALLYALVGPLAALLATLALAALLLLRPARTRRARASLADTEPRVQRVIQLPDGSLRRAIVAPVAQPQGERLVLTAEGYLLLDADGRVLHRL